MKDWKRKRFNNRLYMLVMCVLMTLIVVMANLIAGRIPSRYVRFDTSYFGLYSLSRQTKEMLERLAEPVDLYLIAPQGSEDEMLCRLLERYEDLSDQITVKYVDPVLSPDFVAGYTTNKVSDNSILAVSDTRVRILRNSELYPINYDYETGRETQEFDGEGQITSAIHYVTADTLMEIGSITGHGENELTEQFQDALKKEGVRYKELNLMTAGNSLQQTMCVMLNSPATDLTKQEAEVLEDYLENGGKMLLMSGVSAAKKPNLETVLKGYGLAPCQGVIIEGDGNRCIPSYPNFLLPRLNEGDITDPLLEEDSLVLLPNSHGIELLPDARATVKRNKLMMTSEDSYLKTDMSVLACRPEDMMGPFCVAVAISEETGVGQTRIVWIANSSLLTDEIDEMVGGNNTDFVLNALGWLNGQAESTTIRPKMASSVPLRLTSTQAMIWGSLFVLGLPVLIIGVGVFISIRRMRK